MKAKHEIVARALRPFAFATPQSSGPMGVIPLLAPDAAGQYALPLSGIKLSAVRGYGRVELTNPDDDGGGLGIVPLHIGYIQDGAQNHALCRSSFIAKGQKLMHEDACCVQESQGGYIRNATAFVLPLHLREEALRLRGTPGYSKLWSAISGFNRKLGLPDEGHLEHLVCRRRAELTPYASRFELLPGQRGAVFLLHDRVIGLEIGPTATYFSEVWAPLASFCYGAAAFQAEAEKGDPEVRPVEPFEADSLTDLRCALLAARKARETHLRQIVASAPIGDGCLTEEDQYLDFRLATLNGRRFGGQVVFEDGALVYASIFAARSYLPN